MHIAKLFFLFSFFSGGQTFRDYNTAVFISPTIENSDIIQHVDMKLYHSIALST